MAAICGLATTRDTTAAVAAAATRSRQARLTSHGTRAASTTISTRTNDSWSVSRLAPRTTPRITACLRPGLAAQPHRRLERQRQEHRPGRQVELVPGMPGHDGGQPEECAGEDRAGLRGQPQPCQPVGGVAQQPGYEDRQQVVGGAGPEQHRDRHHQHALEGHQGVVAELDPGRRDDRPGVPRVGQVRYRVGHPPEVPHVDAGVPGGLQLAVCQVGRPRPGDRDANRHVAGQQCQMPCGRAGGQRAAGGPHQPPPARRRGRGGTGTGERRAGCRGLRRDRGRHAGSAADAGAGAPAAQRTAFRFACLAPVIRPYAGRVAPGPFAACSLHHSPLLRVMGTHDTRVAPKSRPGFLATASPSLSTGIEPATGVT